MGTKGEKKRPGSKEDSKLVRKARKIETAEHDKSRKSKTSKSPKNEPGEMDDPKVKRVEAKTNGMANDHAKSEPMQPAKNRTSTKSSMTTRPEACANTPTTDVSLDLSVHSDAPEDLRFLVHEFLLQEGFISAAAHTKKAMLQRPRTEAKSRRRPGFPTLLQIWQEWVEDYDQDMQAMSDISSSSADEMDAPIVRTRSSSPSGSSTTSSSEDSSSDHEPARLKSLEVPKTYTDSSSSDSESTNSSDDSSSSDSESTSSAENLPVTTSTVQETAPAIVEKVITPGRANDVTMAREVIIKDIVTPVQILATKENLRKRQAIDSAERSGTRRQKVVNTPFKRVPESTAVDPRFASNAYQSYDYADRAHQDLVITKGKGFTKEKNKKKRGTYRGGAIDTGGGGGIRFSD